MEENHTLGRPPYHVDPETETEEIEIMQDPTTELFNAHAELCDEARAIMEEKNHDYSGATGDPFANFRGSEAFDITPEIGIMLRMQDKMMRIKTFVEKGQLHVKGEGLRDAALDLINYTVLLHQLAGERSC